MLFFLLSLSLFVYVLFLLFSFPLNRLSLFLPFFFFLRSLSLSSFRVIHSFSFPSYFHTFTFFHSFYFLIFDSFFSLCACFLLVFYFKFIFYFFFPFLLYSSLFSLVLPCFSSLSRHAFLLVTVSLVFLLFSTLVLNLSIWNRMLVLSSVNSVSNYLSSILSWIKYVTCSHLHIISFVSFFFVPFVFSPRIFIYFVYPVKRRISRLMQILDHSQCLLR
jgi:hypothetical protein